MSKFDPEKLKALQAAKGAKVGGVRVAKPAGATKVVINEDIKVTGAVTKLGSRPLTNVSEANFFHADGTVTHFQKPKVIAAVQNNTYCVTGKAHKKQLAELMPGILNQIGLEGLQQLKDLMGAGESAEAEEEETPDLVEA